MRLLILLILCCGCSALAQSPWPAAELERIVVKPGEGEAVLGKAAVKLRTRTWEDKYDGQPSPRPVWTGMHLFEDQETPAKGVREILKEMRVGGVVRTRLPLRALIRGNYNAVYPQHPVFVEIEVLEVYPQADAEWVSVREGSGERVSHRWDMLSIRCQAWTDKFYGEDRFHATGAEPEQVRLTGRTALGWRQALSGMKAGEVRRIKLPYYLAWNAPGTRRLSARGPLYFEIELIGFID